MVVQLQRAHRAGAVGLPRGGARVAGVAPAEAQVFARDRLAKRAASAQSQGPGDGEAEVAAGAAQEDLWERRSARRLAVAADQTPAMPSPRLHTTHLFRRSRRHAERGARAAQDGVERRGGWSLHP